jgi:hypothetical protein
MIEERLKAKYASEIRALLDYQETLERRIKTFESSIAYYNSEVARKFILELQAKITTAREIIIDALEDAQIYPQPQDMKTRLTFNFDAFNELREVLK